MPRKRKRNVIIFYSPGTSFYGEVFNEVGKGGAHYALRADNWNISYPPPEYFDYNVDVGNARKGGLLKSLFSGINGILLPDNVTDFDRIAALGLPMVRKTRLDLGVSLKKFAAILGVNEMTMVNWEQAKTRPRHVEQLEDRLAQLAPLAAPERLPTPTKTFFTATRFMEGRSVNGMPRAMQVGKKPVLIKVENFKE